MTNDQLKVYVKGKLADLEKERDMAEVANKGRLSFGLNSKDYKDLPSWQNLLRSKKSLVRVFWTSCFLISFIIVGIASNVVDGISVNWIKAIVTWISTSLFATLVYVFGFYFSLFYRVRKTEHEVRKLIYEDILARIEKEQPQLV